MVQTIIAVDPVRRHRGLLVEIYSESLPDRELQKTADEFKRRLFDGSIRVGLVVTPDILLVVRDLVTEVAFAANRFEVRRVSMPELLQHAGLGKPRPGLGFFQQVRRWLEAVGTSWFSFLWPEAVPVMVPDVVGHLVQVDLEEYDGLLDQGDAA